MERAGEGGAVKEYDDCVCGAVAVLEHVTIQNVGSMEITRDEWRVVCQRCNLSTEWTVSRIAAVALWIKELDWWEMKT